MAGRGEKSAQNGRKGKHRGNGEGSIWQMETGRKYWVAEVSLGYQNGKRARKRVYGKTRQEVAAKLLAVQQAASEGKLMPADLDALTVGAYMEKWLEYKTARLRPKTVHSYTQLTRVHIIPALGHMRLREVRPYDINSFVTAKLTQGNLSRRTVQYLRVLLSMAFTSAVNNEILENNVVKKTEAISLEEKEQVVFSMQQCRALQAAFRGHRQEALFVTTLNLGLRLGEVRGLRWENVHIEGEGKGGTIYVKEQLQKINGAYHLTPPKTRSGVRTIPLPPFVAEALLRHRERQEQEKALAGEGWHGGEWRLVFPNRTGEPQTERWVRRQFQGVLAKANLPKIRFHDLRSLAISMLVVAGVHPRIIMKIVGHKTLHQTMVVYARVLQGEDQAAADALQKLMGGGDAADEADAPTKVTINGALPDARTHEAAADAPLAAGAA